MSCLHSLLLSCFSLAGTLGCQFSIFTPTRLRSLQYPFSVYHIHNTYFLMSLSFPFRGYDIDIIAISSFSFPVSFYPRFLTPLFLPSFHSCNDPLNTCTILDLYI